MPKEKNQSCAPKTAVAYARYSSAGQRDVSIEQQLGDIRAFAAREGYMLVHEYADHAKSGFKHVSARTEFQAMLAAAEAGSFDTVIAWKVDRFGRNREESAIFKGRLRRFGVSVVYAMEPIPEGAAGVLLEGMLEATAEWYSRNLSENVRRGMTDNARRCLYNGYPVLGYSVSQDRRYQIDPPSAAVVRQIFALYAEGESYTTLSRKLIQHGILTRNGKPYSKSRLSEMLSNENYIGVYKWGDIRIPGGMPAIIDDSTWEAVQRMKRKTARHIEQGNIDFILTGKAYCGLCGRPLIGDSGTSKTGDRHYYYTCQGRKKDHTCDFRNVRKSWLEDLILDEIIDRVLTGPQMERIADAVMEQQRKAASVSPLAKMEQEQKALRRKMDNINRAIEEGIWDETTAERLRELSSAEKTLRESIEALRFSQSQLVSRDRVLFFLHRFASGDRQDLRHRKFIVSTFVNAVYVFPDHVDLVINAIEGCERIPLTSLKPASESSDAFRLVHIPEPCPNVGVFRIIIPLEDKKSS